MQSEKPSDANLAATSTAEEQKSRERTPEDGKSPQPRSKEAARVILPGETATAPSSSVPTMIEPPATLQSNASELTIIEEQSEDIPAPTSTAESATWSCPKCTFANHSLVPSCEMCTTPRPAPLQQEEQPPQQQLPKATVSVIVSDSQNRQEVCSAALYFANMRPLQKLVDVVETAAPPSPNKELVPATPNTEDDCERDPERTVSMDDRASPVLMVPSKPRILEPELSENPFDGTLVRFFYSISITHSV